MKIKKEGIVITNFIVNHKKTILTIFLICFVLSIYFSTKVKVDYNLMDYLPEDVASTKSLEVMEQEYDTNLENLRIMINDTTYQNAIEIKNQIKQINGVKEITFLDDTYSINTPLETIDSSIVEQWYKDNHAIFSVTIDEDNKEDVIEQIRQIIGDDNYLSGSAYEEYMAEISTSKEITQIMCFVIPLIFVILILTTTSYFEPVLFMICIGVAIVLNNGTNAIFGTISFVTSAASNILQLAVSMDYSIFLLQQFSKERKKGKDVTLSMTSALKKSYKSIFSSGLTTVVGFAALIVMRFKIGPDMGLVMAKSIVLSIASVLILLPVLTIYSYKLIEKTHHKEFIKESSALGKVVFNGRYIILAIFIIVLIPCYIASQKISFTYGSSEMFNNTRTQAGVEHVETEKVFGKSNNIVLMVPKGDLYKEQVLTNEIKELSDVKDVISYSETVGNVVPMQYLNEETLKLLESDNYSRFVISIDLPIQGDDTFEMVENLRSIANKYYNTSYLVGESVNTYDLKQTVISDNVKVNALAIIAIILILLVEFKSITLPIILVFVIEGAIWINLSIPYFTSLRLNYISYLIISSIQLGATVDYAILFTDRYLFARQKNNAKDSIIQTLKNTTLSIITSGGILTIAGLLLGFKSTNTVISELGILVGRGAIISVILVLFVLPCLFIVLDKVIEKTTKNSNFYHGKEKLDKGQDEHKSNKGNSNVNKSKDKNIENKDEYKIIEI